MSESEDEASKRRRAWWIALDTENLDFIDSHAGSERPSQLQVYVQKALSSERRMAFQLLVERYQDRLPADWKNDLLKRMAHDGNTGAVRTLLALGIDDLNVGYPLIPATMAGHIEVVRVLLEAGADPNHGDLRFGNALNFANEDRYPEVVSLLKDYGGKPLVLTGWGREASSAGWLRSLNEQAGRTWRTLFPPSRKKVLKVFEKAVPDAFAQLSKDEGLLCFALCTDSDLRTIYATGYTASDRASFDEESFCYLPAEWMRLEGGGGLIEQASELLSKWTDRQYGREDASIGPDDDQLRPWKLSMFEAMVDILIQQRDAGHLGSSVPILLGPHDGSDWWSVRVSEATERLNTPEFFAEWKKHAC